MKLKITLSFTLIYSFIAVSFAKEVDIVSKVNEVTVYHSGALVSRTSNQRLETGMQEIVLKNISSKLVLSTITINNKEVTILNKSIIKKLTKEQFNQLEDERNALLNQLALLEVKYNESNFVNEVADLEKMLDFYSKKIMELKKQLRFVDLSIAEAKTLEEVKLNNENAAILKLLVSVEKTLNSDLEIEYITGGIGWSPFYEINVQSSSEKEIQVKYLARIMSQTGENWDNVVVHLSSSFPLSSPRSLPAAEEPWTLTSRSKYTNQNNNTNFAQEQIQQQQVISKLEGVEYQEISIPSYLKLRTLKGTYSIKSNSTVFSFPIMTVKLPATYYFYGFPSIDTEVYLVSEIIGWDTLGFVDGIANITYNKNNIGKTVLKFSEFSDTLLLPVGKDNSIFMKRKEIADQKYAKEPTNFNKKKKITYAYEYTLKNNNSFPVVFELKEQFPISQSKSAEVTLDKTTDGAVDYEAGEITWAIEIKPGELFKKELIYTVVFDGSFSFSKASPHKKRYRTISAPKF